MERQCQRCWKEGSREVDEIEPLFSTQAKIIFTMKYKNIKNINSKK
jgi:hypothetical protein